MGRFRDIGRPRYRPKFPDKYQVIYADPPWKFGIYVSGNRAPENHYPCLEMEDICRLRVKNLAAEDAVVWNFVEFFL
jgi:hypothetical protein